MDSSDQAPDSEAAEATTSESAAIETTEAMLYCPVCNTRLTSRKCKLLCEQCGYFMSCADYY
jgi:Zn finger protein HypA/HybF involved in hydrogenase expression